MEKMTKEQKVERNEKVINAYQNGRDIEAIAEELGISKKTVLGILIYTKVYQAPEKPKKEKRPSKAEILTRAEVPERLLYIAGVRQLSTDSILELSELMDGKDRQEWKGIYKKTTA